MPLLTMSPFKAHCDHEDLGPPHPGEILREDMMPHYRLTVDDLAARLNISADHAAGLIAERVSIDADLATRLGASFALCPRYWQALQLQYDLWHNRPVSGSDAMDTGHAWYARSGSVAA